MKTKRSIASLILGAGLCASAAAFAGASVSDAADAVSSALPAEHRLGDVTFRSGGVGDDEVAAMKQAATQYPLELLFVVKDESGRSAYGAADLVTIRNVFEEVVLDTRSEGPILLVRLEPGKYTVEAAHNGQSQKRTVTLVRDQHARLIFLW